MAEGVQDYFVVDSMAKDLNGSAVRHRQNHVHAAQVTGNMTIVSESVDRDAWTLARTGKKQVLKRRFGLASMIGFCCSLMTTWEGTIINITFGLTNGGPAGLIWGFLVCWIGTLSVFVSMGELASMLPTAGGQYHWVSILAPKKYSCFLSYVTGWVTVTAWIAAPTVASFVAGDLIQNIIALNHPDFVAHPWQVVLFMYACLLLALIANNYLGTILPLIEILILIIHVVGFLTVLIPLVVLGSPTNGTSIFTTFFDGGNWHSQTLSLFIGLFGNAGAFLGTDGAIHMAEEIANSPVNTPNSMILAIVLNGVLGFVILIVFLLYAPSTEQILNASVTEGFPFMNILQYAIKNNTGADVLISLLIALNTCSIFAILSSGSRMLWSFAREKAVPGWSWLRRIDRRTSIPTYSVYSVVFFAACLGLINLGSTTTFNALLSLILEGFYNSYLIVLCLLLWRRVKGDIRDERTEEATLGPGLTAMDSGSRHHVDLVWGPWRLKGWLGTVNNIFAIIYLIIIIFFGFWPADRMVTAMNMNWSVVVLGGIVILSLIYYAVRARHHYHGPIIEVEIVKD